MYCLQWLIPVLLIPKPVNPALLYNHVALMVLYLTGFFLERKPCTICSIIFVVALVLLCSSSSCDDGEGGVGGLNCILSSGSSDDSEDCPAAPIQDSTGCEH